MLTDLRVGDGGSVSRKFHPGITDPVRLGLVASLARPGGNATGFAAQNHERPGKWMELVKEAECLGRKANEPLA